MTSGLLPAVVSGETSEPWPTVTVEGDVVVEPEPRGKPDVVVVIGAVIEISGPTVVPVPVPVPVVPVALPAPCSLNPWGSPWSPRSWTPNRCSRSAMRIRIPTGPPGSWSIALARQVVRWQGTILR